MPQKLGLFASIVRFRITRWARVFRMVMPSDDVALMSQLWITNGSEGLPVPRATPFGEVKLSSPSITMGVCEVRLAGVKGWEALPGAPSTRRRARTQSEAQGPTLNSRSGLPFIATSPPTPHGSRRYFTIPSGGGARYDSLSHLNSTDGGIHMTLGP